jgi:hypothetical protein
VDGRFLEAVFNEPKHVVCGRVLRPLCLYHSMLLVVDDNPLHECAVGEVITWADLLTAVLICSAPEQSLREYTFIPNGFFAKMRMLVWLRFARRRYKLAKELAKFENYVKDYSTRPKYWSDDKGGNSMVKAPWILSLASFLEDHSNMTEHEIMVAPVGVVLWKTAAIAEQNGVARGEMVSEEEEKAVELLKSM